MARRFPFRIGRSPSANLCLEDAGIYDDHLEIHLLPDRAIQAVVPEPAMASINHQPITEAILHSGDVIELGSVRLQFSLAPTRQRSLKAAGDIDLAAFSNLVPRPGVVDLLAGLICLTRPAFQPPRVARWIFSPVGAVPK